MISSAVLMLVAGARAQEPASAPVSTERVFERYHVLSLDNGAGLAAWFEAPSPEAPTPLAEHIERAFSSALGSGGQLHQELDLWYPPAGPAVEGCDAAWRPLSAPEGGRVCLGAAGADPDSEQIARSVVDLRARRSSVPSIELLVSDLAGQAEGSACVGPDARSPLLAAADRDQDQDHVVVGLITAKMPAFDAMATVGTSARWRRRAPVRLVPRLVARPGEADCWTWTQDLVTPGEERSLAVLALGHDVKAGDLLGALTTFQVSLAQESGEALEFRFAATELAAESGGERLASFERTPDGLKISWSPEVWKRPPGLSCDALVQQGAARLTLSLSPQGDRVESLELPPLDPCAGSVVVGRDLLGPPLEALSFARWTEPRVYATLELTAAQSAAGWEQALNLVSTSAVLAPELLGWRSFDEALRRRGAPWSQRVTFDAAVLPAGLDPTPRATFTLVGFVGGSLVAMGIAARRRASDTSRQEEMMAERVLRHPYESIDDTLRHVAEAWAAGQGARIRRLVALGVAGAALTAVLVYQILLLIQ